MSSLEKGILYIVATPIGNLQDITFRAIEILKKVEIILAEDTRVTSKLLSTLSIRNQQILISCHDFNEEQRIEQVKQLLDDNKNIALVSDAGTPLISDPGYKIVVTLRRDGYTIVPIPGASAVITALSASGLPSNSFVFKGFLSSKKNKRQQELESFIKLNSTVIIYESVHRIRYLLDDISEILPACNIVVVKELTKQFEQFLSGKAYEIKKYFVDNPDRLKGEFVILLDCNKSNQLNIESNIDQETFLKELLLELPLNKAVKITTKVLNLKKNEVYEKALQFKKRLEN
ncbi:16S rRNA (cytidine(1402)-2'-O)-methyltransferase [Allofrancisella guangzhouensis]|uniref:Ribosomal RNA small subunit methyltransferase I n=1 Tax=Allofrancisella guangzhouensis TaxID=594679 RepID=A0A0A8E403_9GAMM|nr:16S rRNA (cytidine(1402)-2'-O)-methyltransferase [Allofrancisella guangzhouensis]AJC48342.1 SAM-dependent methyltransferase [Allofrancisella guangzhouensis]MBK2026567.1 16S rRNA (cytidine(1402)-2'-O)-methyltransferase [Allofrancisella guangzhouensis]MBK2044311.1 16S rRNA (cytidine(1402)-2'-O)-methyltransferase [Allofrancisella guangzhouensis]MBK2045554.1 16S rRNA (cytidine(1402)-2'-O)-methyltransferase [Allofrancisella guangzhouensis]